MKLLRPTRARRRYTQKLVRPPAEVFPLLCPVREIDWVPGWDPEVVYSTRGIAELDCVFMTRDPHGESIWTVTEHDRARWRIEMVKVTPGLVVVRLEISLRDSGDGGTAADISYGFTALSKAGEAYVAERTEDWYGQFMRTWEAAINHYLTTGEKVEA